MIGKRKIYRIINTRVKRTAWYHSLWNGADKFWKNPPFDLDVVNLGSGGALHAFNYDGLPIKGANWALWPQSLVHDFNILKNYFSFIKPGGTVVITACPFGFLKNPNYNVASNLKYYTFLHPATILDFDENERMKALLLRDNPFSVKPKRCLKELYKYYCDKYLEKKEVSADSRIDFAQNARNMVDAWKKQFGINDLGAPLSEKHQLEYNSRQQTLLDIVRFCKERDLKPVVVYPPIHQELRNIFPEYFVNITKSFMGGGNSQIVEFYDYSDYPAISDDKYFKTSYFLNELGAKKFTEILLKDLKLIK
ncbi:MAG: hypothetical protein Q4F69_00030 [Bacteroidia bacterium]|nr:hypothetical protein [Bacteroidia bacterium]